MCRLFALRASSAASVQSELLSGRNALRLRSHEHKDGWGLAYWERPDAPLCRATGLSPAHADPEFEAICSRVVAQSILAHVRLASVGPVHPDNVHPFVEGRWAFAHNGTVHAYERHQVALEARLPGERRDRLRGATDSERCFQLFLTQLEQEGALVEAPRAEPVARALARTVRTVEAITDGPEGRSALNFLVTDGRVLVASRRGRTLFFSTRERWAPLPGQGVQQLAVASEALGDEGEWHPVGEDEVVGVDADLTFRRWSLSEL